MKKILSIGVILLFIGLALAPCIDGYSIVDIIVDRIEFDNEDCGCDKSIDWDFPIICSILLLIYLIALDNLPFRLLAHIIQIIAGKLGGCTGIP